MKGLDKLIVGASLLKLVGCGDCDDVKDHIEQEHSDAGTRERPSRGDLCTEREYIQEIRGTVKSCASACRGITIEGQVAECRIPTEVSPSGVETVLLHEDCGRTPNQGYTMNCECVAPVCTTDPSENPMLDPDLNDDIRGNNTPNE